MAWAGDQCHLVIRRHPTHVGYADIEVWSIEPPLPPTKRVTLYSCVERHLESWLPVVWGDASPLPRLHAARMHAMLDMGGMCVVTIARGEGELYQIVDVNPTFDGELATV